MHDIWIINGIPGAGKTTTARALATRFAKAVHIEGDRLQEWIISGGVAPGQAPADEEARQIHLNIRNQCLLACSYAAEGFISVIDYVLVNRSRVEEYRSQIPGLQIRLVTLAPRLAVALERDRLRPEKSVGAAWNYLDEIMGKELAGVGLWVDNSEKSVEDVVDHILAHSEVAIV